MIGGVVTLMIIVVMLTYGSIKMKQMIEHHNPLVYQFVEKDVFDSSEKLNLNEIGFRLAFTVEGFRDR